MNKNNQTTSTKCQYQAADSKPKWWLLVKWFKTIRIKETHKATVPINTWKPWNPVAMKKHEPKTESLIAKLASKYSKTCNAVKRTAKTKVIDKLIIACFLALIIIAWCAQVTVAPELNKKNCAFLPLKFR